MATQNAAYFAFNRGLVSRLALARADIKRLALAAIDYVNYMPRVLGSMMLRPGTKHIGSTKDNEAVRSLPFVFSTSDKAILELSALVMRVWIDDELVTRVAVTTAVLNGDFTTNLNDWTDGDEAGATSAWATGGFMSLIGTGELAAIRTQQVVCAGANIGKEHALDIVIARGPVTFMVGSSAGGVDYVAQTELGTGTHSLAFTPTGDFYVRFQSRLEREVSVNSCNVAAAGAMELQAPWTAAILDEVRYDQSADVVFVAARDFQQQKIERRAVHSWSIVDYAPLDGPFRTENTGPTTLTASVLTGNGSLTASLPTFFTTHVGALFALTHTGQDVIKAINAQNIFSDPIEVTGVGVARAFIYQVSAITGTGTTATLQRAFGTPTTWLDVLTETADDQVSIEDGFDNQIIYYRMGVKTGDFVLGPIQVELVFPGGVTRGVVRATGYTSNVVLSVEVLTPLAAITATDQWEEGKWSDYRGWPTSVAMYEGRLGWAGKDSVDLSVSDGFESFDPMLEGDAGPISRSIGAGPVDTINWLVALQRLMLGAQSAEFSCRSNAFDEPLTPTNFNLKKAGRQGSAKVGAVALEDQGIYVQRGGYRVFALEFAGDKADYANQHLSALVPSIGKPSIVRVAVQTQPDPRVHFVRSNGTVAVLVFDKNESVTCWLEVESPSAGGMIEDVVVLPSSEGEAEDHVYYVVAREIDGATVRYYERWSTEEQCRGVDDDDEPTQLCRLADSHVVYEDITPTNVLTGLEHLEGESVVVWADGRDVGTDPDDDTVQLYTVSGGQITLAASVGNVSNAVVGLSYIAQWRSGKLVQLANQLGSGMKNTKNIPNLGLILADVHRKGVKFGPDFDNLNDLASIEDGAPVDDDAVRSELDGEAYAFPGTWTIDQRICLQSQAPRPATILAISCDVDF
jgi:hypothetical protein